MVFVPMLSCRSLGSVRSAPGSAAAAGVAQAIGDAFVQSGFFAAVEHSVSARTIDRALGAARGFFAADAAVKRNAAMEQREGYRGYTGLGAEKTGDRPDMKETLDFGMYRETLYRQGIKFAGENYFPSPEYEQAMTAYMKEMENFGELVMRAVAIYLGLPLTSFDSTPESVHLSRALYYPAVSKTEADAPAVQGIGEHTDYGLLAMVVATGPGLEAKDVNGKWHQVPHVDHSIVVNIGDMMENWTNGRMRATTHRVLHKNTVDRYSIPFFYEPSFNTVVQPFPQLLKPGDEIKYQPIHYGKHVLEAFARSFKDHSLSAEYRAKHGNPNPQQLQ